MARSALFSNQQIGGMFAIEDMSRSTGNRWYVDSGSSTGSDAAGYGQNPDAPFVTLDYAVGLTTASNGDTIYVMPGHAETQSASGSLFALDVIGINVIGQGEGTLRPTFTFSHTGAATTISAASVTLQNVKFVCGVDSVTAPLTISAANVTLKDVEFVDTNAVEFVVGVTTTAAADNLLIDGFRYVGDIIAPNALTIGIQLAGCDNVIVQNSVFDGTASTAWINFSVAVDNVHVRDCIFNNVGTALTKDVVDTATGSTWTASGCFDLVGGYGFTGGSGTALAADGTGSAVSAAVAVIDEFHDVPAANNTLNAQINEVIGNKTDTVAAGDVTATDTLVGYIKQIVSELSGATGIATWPAGAAAASGVSVSEALRYMSELQSPRLATATSTSALTTGTLWTYAGSIEIVHIIGRVTTIIQNQATTVQLTITPDALAAYAICATKDIDNFAVGSLLSITGTAANALVSTTAVGSIGPGQANSVIATCVTNGVISTVFGAASTGAIVWEMVWRPLSAGATVT